MNKTLKWILIAVVLAVVGNIAKESVKASKEVDARLAFKTSCQRQAQSAATIAPDKVDAVCACVVDKTTKRLGEAGFTRLAMVKDSTEADRQTLMESMASCMDENLPPK